MQTKINAEQLNDHKLMYSHIHQIFSSFVHCNQGEHSLQ